ncbi:serine/threonine-protein kinase PknB [Abditibacteriota bacterium]|nr:serine/threonine-protein kinase PknB [Abditibacteriota bacterium]
MIDTIGEIGHSLNGLTPIPPIGSAHRDPSLSNCFGCRFRSGPRRPVDAWMKSPGSTSFRETLSTPMNTPVSAGQHLGPYEIRELLGEGGMAQVWKAWNEGLARFEALKFPLLQAATPGNEQTFITRFLGEARVAASLHHPHIATIYSVSSDAEQPYFAMQFVTGRGLDDFITRNGKISALETLAILEPVAAALDYAHDMGVVHRDIKPANILLHANSGGGWHPFVVDFGIARAAQEDGTQAPRLTRVGAIVGTPEYMSPEQIQSLPTTRASDQYSLGIVAYEMLCGRPPFMVASGASTVSVLMQHVKDQPPLPDPVSADVSPALGRALLWALQKNPSARAPSCSAWVAAMKEAVGSASVIPRPIPSRAKPMWVIPLTVVGVLCAFGVGYSAFRPGSPEVTATATPLPVPTFTAAPIAPENRTIINTVPLATPVPIKVEPTPDARLVQSQTLAKQAGEKVDTSTAILQELMSKPKVTDADKAAYKKQISALNEAYDLATHATRLDIKNEEAWVQLCRATVYLDKCGEENLVEKAAAHFPSSSRFKPLVALAKSNAKDGCY